MAAAVPLPEEVVAGPPLSKPGVCIVGFAEGHRHLAPFDDDQWEFWGLNRLHVALPDRPWHRWFELHDLQQFYAADQQQDHRLFLKGFQGPIYVRPQDMQVAGEWGIDATPYPKQKILTEFGPYFTNSISWMLAMAIVMGAERIGLYGVDMAVDHLMQNEYSHQRPSCEYMLGIAAGRGIEIQMPEGCDLLKASHLYGFEDSTPLGGKWKSRYTEIGQRKENIKQQVAQLDAQRGQLVGMINQLDGAMQEVEYNLRNHLTPMEVRDG